MGTMSFVNVTSPEGGAGVWAVGPAVTARSATSSRLKGRRNRGKRPVDMTTSSEAAGSPFIGGTSVRRLLPVVHSMELDVQREWVHADRDREPALASG